MHHRDFVAENVVCRFAERRKHKHSQLLFLAVGAKLNFDEDFLPLEKPDVSVLQYAVKHLNVVIKINT